MHALLAKSEQAAAASAHYVPACSLCGCAPVSVARCTRFARVPLPLAISDNDPSLQESRTRFCEPKVPPCPPEVVVKVLRKRPRCPVGPPVPDLFLRHAPQAWHHRHTCRVHVRQGLRPRRARYFVFPHFVSSPCCSYVARLSH